MSVWLAAVVLPEITEPKAYSLDPSSALRAIDLTSQLACMLLAKTESSSRLEMKACLRTAKI